MKIEVSIANIDFKAKILAVKSEKIIDLNKRYNCINELKLGLYALKDIKIDQNNEQLWELENKICQFGKNELFDDQFVQADSLIGELPFRGRSI